MQIIDTRVHEALIALLTNAQFDGVCKIISGDTGLGLSFSAAAFVAEDPSSRFIVRLLPEDSFQSTLNQIADEIGSSPTLIDGYKKKVSGPKAGKLRRASELLAKRLDPLARSILIIVDQVELLGSARQLDRLAHQIERELEMIKPVLVLMGSADLKLPASNFIVPDERSMVTKRLCDRYDLISFRENQVDGSDVLKIAFAHGASTDLAKMVRRLWRNNKVRPSHFQIERAVQVLGKHPHAKPLSYREAVRTLMSG